MAEDNKNTPEPITADKIAEIVNAAVTAHIKRFEKSQSEAVAKLIEDKIPKAPVADPKNEPDPKKLTPEQLALQNQLDEIKKALLDSENKRAAIERQARDERAYADLRSHLSGVRPELQEVAARDLFHAQKRVVFDEQSQRYLFKISKAPAAGMQEEEMLLPIQDGVNHWLKSKEAAGFLPAPTGAGGGANTRAPMAGTAPSGKDRNGLPTWDKPATSDQDKLARAYEREQALAARQNQK
jgi:hypothetical protein